MKLTPREVYDKCKSEGMPTYLCLHFMEEAEVGKTFHKCIMKSKDNNSLSFSDCTNILYSVYGYKTVEKMSRPNLFAKIDRMMRAIIDYTDTEMINEEIDFIKS